MPGLATGVATLDAALPGGGLPRGRLTEITGAPGSGVTTFARQLVTAALGAGWWVAYVDAARTLAPRDWAALGVHEGLWVVRPTDATRGAWCADVLLRSGAFGLVILDGAPVLPRPVSVRLVRLARASDAAFVLLGADGQRSGVAGALQLRVQRTATAAAPKRQHATLDLAARLAGQAPASLAPPAPVATPATRRRMLITIEKGGPVQRVEVECASEGTRCVREDPQIPDRRGVARRDTVRYSERAGSEHTASKRAGNERSSNERSRRTALGRATDCPA